MTVADQLRESHSFAHTSSEEVMAEFGHKEYDLPVPFCFIIKFQYNAHFHWFKQRAF